MQNFLKLDNSSMTNVLFARLNRIHYVSFSFTVGTEICSGKMLNRYYLTIAKEFHALCLREVIIGITMAKCPLLNYLILTGKLYLWDCRKNQALPNIEGSKFKVRIK